MPEKGRKYNSILQAKARCAATHFRVDLSPLSIGGLARRPPFFGRRIRHDNSGGQRQKCRTAL